MSATMARQGSEVQLEQSDMRLALNLAKMTKKGFSCASIKKTQQLNMNPHAQVQEGTKQAVVCPGHN